MDTPPLSDTALRRSARKVKRASVSPTNIAKCSRLGANNILAYLADDLIGRILFSGYLGKSWYNTICLILVCTKFKDIGKTYIAYVKNKDRFHVHPQTLRTLELGVLGINNIAPNLVYLDLSYSHEILFDQRLGDMLLALRRTLRGLSLRCTGVPDAFLRTYVSQLSLLKFLDVSQACTKDKNLVSDSGTLPLTNLTNLKWLNMSMCNITDATILALCKSVPQMEHIALYSCSALTDASLVAMRDWRLHSLDVSNCGLLTVEGLSALTDARAPISSTLVNLAASYLRNAASARALPELLKLPKLRRLEFRKTSPEAVPVSAGLEKQVRAQLEVAVLKHSDQLRGVRTLSIIEPHPPVTSLCPVLCWPYTTAEL